MKVGIVGAGFAGLSAAYDLVKAGHQVTIFDRDSQLGGLAATFEMGNQKLEKFYHHWLGTDTITFDFIKEIGQGDKLMFKESRVGIYYANTIYRFSSPFDLLKFKPLPFFSRIRFGFSVFYAWMIKDMKAVESVSAEAWLQKVAGKTAYETIWKPLLIGKFGEDYYRDVAAVWLWNKLIQRGKSREGAAAKERLAYYKGGFSAFLNDLYAHIEGVGGKLSLQTEVKQILPKTDGSGVDLAISREGVESTETFDRVLYTGHTPEFSPLARDAGHADYAANLDKIKYLANICLILESKKSLSEIYWLNVNDPGFPFVGIIEHTNFEGRENYSGNHLIYLSKYIPTSHPLYKLNSQELFEFACPHIEKMFPKFNKDDVVNVYGWRAEYAQPIISINYKSLIPDYKTPMPNVYLCTMAQVYPEDRGTNYAIHHGRKVAALINAESK